MKKESLLLLLLLSAPLAHAEDLTRWVNPLIGTDNSMAISNGDLLPTVALPFGNASWTPQTIATRWIYLYKSKTVQGIRLTHQPSPWIGDYGDFLVVPMVGPYKPKTAYPLDHRKEFSAPHSYKLTVGSPGIVMEVTPTMHGGVLRFTFPSSTDASVLIDIPGINSSAEIFLSKNRVEGVSTSNTRGVPKKKKFGCYFVLEADAPVKNFEVWEEKQPPYHVVNKSGRHAMALLRFGDLRGKPVTMRIGTSFIGRDQAQLNLEREVGIRNFENVRDAAKAAWQKLLSRVEIEGATAEQRTVFYTALYRTLLFPRTFHETDKNGRAVHYSPYDGKVHPGVLFTDNGFWDTFRTVYPFFSVVYPDLLPDILQGYVNAYKEGGWLPQWQSPGYQSCMIGTHSDAVFADAVVKGIRGFDVETAYEASVKNGDVPSKRGQYGRVGLDYYRKLGYIPADKMDQSVSRTLEYAYDDFCLSQFARALGKEKDADRFLERSRNYRNVFNSTTGFMQGRLENGEWLGPIDPFLWGPEYTEGNAWQHTWFVPHDPLDLARLMGGEGFFIEKLDRLFALPPGHKIGNHKKILHDMNEMVRADMGQYHHGNQPSHHIPYLYAIAGKPQKTQARVRQIMTRLYKAAPDGWIGDDDNGEMSAWYLFSAMGFYPVCPGRPEYTFGSPLFGKITVRRPSGDPFVIEAINNGGGNVYVQSVAMNDRPVSGVLLDHKDIATGGTLRFSMGARARQR